LSVWGAWMGLGDVSVVQLKDVHSYPGRSVLYSYCLSVCLRLFSDVVLPLTDKPQLKIPSKLKEAIRGAKEETERRLKDEQKLVCYQYIDDCIVI
jgi:hypothetical protein